MTSLRALLSKLRDPVIILPYLWYGTRERLAGYFRVEMTVKAEPGWNEVELELLRKPEIRATARVLVPAREARSGIISDIADTVVYSNVLSKWRMILTLAFSNARTRKPFKGVAAFYRALHRGVNPVFYVSKSPWNLYAPLVEFLGLQGLPLGRAPPSGAHPRDLYPLHRLECPPYQID
jgi:phosphatidate phosphatase APP1